MTGYDAIFDQTADGGSGAAALTVPAFAETPTPWELKPDMGYGYGKDGKTFVYKMGTSNAGLLLKGAKKVPKGTLFFIGQNGQLYMRTPRISMATAASCSDRIDVPSLLPPQVGPARLAQLIVRNRDKLRLRGRRCPREARADEGSSGNKQDPSPG